MSRPAFAAEDREDPVDRVDPQQVQELVLRAGGDARRELHVGERERRGEPAVGRRGPVQQAQVPARQSRDGGRRRRGPGGPQRGGRGHPAGEPEGGDAPGEAGRSETEQGPAGDLRCLGFAVHGAPFRQPHVSAGYWTLVSEVRPPPSDAVTVTVPASIAATRVANDW